MDMLEIKNVAYSYANSKEKVLSGVNQKFELGKFYAIVGKSGTGKSTLLSLLAGLDKPQTGKILFKNEDIGGCQGSCRKSSIILLSGFSHTSLGIDQFLVDPDQRSGFFSFAAS